MLTTRGGTSIEQIVRACQSVVPGVLPADAIGAAQTERAREARHSRPTVISLYLVLSGATPFSSSSSAPSSSLLTSCARCSCARRKMTKVAAC
jgi:hypothetical protein